MCQLLVIVPFDIKRHLLNILKCWTNYCFKQSFFARVSLIHGSCCYAGFFAYFPQGGR